MVDLADQPALAVSALGHLALRFLDPGDGAGEGVAKLAGFPCAGPSLARQVERSSPGW